MAIATPTILTQAGSTTNASSYATASVTLTAGRLYLVAVVNDGTAPVADPTSVQTTGGAITFAKITAATRGFNTGASASQKVTWWWVIAGSTVTATITISAASATGCAWTVIEVTDGFDAGTTIVTASINSADAATSVTITPTAISRPGNLQIAAWGVSLNLTTDAASGTNWSSLGTGASFNTPATAIETATHLGASTQLTCSGAGSGARGVSVIEINEVSSALVRPRYVKQIVGRTFTRVIRKLRRPGKAMVMALAIQPAGAAALASSCTGTATASAALTTGIPLSTSVTGAATASSVLTTGIPLASSVTCTGTTTAALTTGIPLASAVTGAASTAAVLTTDIPLSSSVTGAATTNATLSTGIPLLSSATGIATTNAALTTAIPLLASVTGIATATADLTASGASSTRRNAIFVFQKERRGIRLGNAKPKRSGAALISFAKASPAQAGAALAASVAGAVTTTAVLSTQIQLASSVTGVATATADLTGGAAPATKRGIINLVKNRPRQKVRRSAAVTLVVAYQPGAAAADLAASVTGTASVVAPLTTAIKLASAVTGAATTAAALSTGIPLASAVTGAATTNAALSTGIPLAVSVTGVVSTSADLTTTPQGLSAVVTGTAVTTASLTTQIQLVTSLSAVAITSADLTNAIQLASQVTGMASVVAPLTTTPAGLSSVASAIATASAALTTGIPLASSVTGASTASAALTTGIPLASSVTAAAQVNAALSVITGFASSVQGTAQVVAGLTTAINLQAVAQCSGTINGSLFAIPGVADSEGITSSMGDDGVTSVAGNDGITWTEDPMSSTPIKNPSFTIKRNDRREPLVRTLKGSDDQPVDLSSATSVKFIMTPISGGSPKVNASANILSPATAGQVQYNWQAVDTDTAGYYKGEWEVTFADTTKESFPNDSEFIVHVKEDLG